MDSLPPQISVLIKVSTVSKSFELSIKTLQEQTVAKDIELILLSNGPEADALKKIAGDRFFTTRIVSIDTTLHEGEYKKVGVDAATAPLIMFSEDHSYLETSCLESIILTHNENDYAAVGPVMANPNPSTGTSWGCFLSFYGQWAYTNPPGSREHLPANQSCYTRKILIANKERLEDKLRVESVFHWELLAKGHRLKLTDSAKVYHLNTSLLRCLLLEYFLSSKIFAESRFKNGALFKRVIYTLGSPLIPFIRLWRIARISRSIQLPISCFLKSLPPLWLCLLAGSLGEAIGYSLGCGDAQFRLDQLLANPDKLVRPADLQEIEQLIARQFQSK